MRIPRQPFSWDEDPNEEPVALGGSRAPGSSEQKDIAAEAEDLVRQSQAAIAREDTEPSIPIVTLTGSDGDPMGSLREPTWWRNSRPSWRLGSRAAVALVLACCLAFAHGWSYGNRSPAAPPLSSVDGRAL